MKLHFYKANPSGNSTILVVDQLPREIYAEVSKRIMADTYLCAEQVGFIEAPENPRAFGRLQMMGGEFCGNAARSIAALIALGGLEEGGLRPFSELEVMIPIEVSGHQGILETRVLNQGSDHSCISEIKMPLPLRIEHEFDRELGEYSLVTYEGILHMVLWNKAPSQEYVGIVRNFLEQRELDTSCFGVLFYDSILSNLVPVVYVEAVDSLVWESSCGSGTMAVASAMADKEARPIDHMQFCQPGGDLFASIDWEGGIKEAWLSGEIALTATGTVYID